MSTNPRFMFHLDFDTKGEPPKVYLYDTQSDGDVVEVFEEPTIKPGRGEWSWEEDDWEPGSFAQALLALLNTSFLPLVSP